MSFQGFLFSLCDPHLQYYLYMIIVATRETPRTFILSLTPVEAKAAEPEEPVQDDEPSTETDNDGQGGDENEQSDDHEHDDQDVDDDDQTQSMDDNHDHSQDVGGDDQSDDDDDDGQSQSQDVGDNGVEGSQDMGESQPGSCDGVSDIAKRHWFFLDVVKTRPHPQWRLTAHAAPPQQLKLMLNLAAPAFTASAPLTARLPGHGMKSFLQPPCLGTQGLVVPRLSRCAWPSCSTLDPITQTS